jgi:hypothetical protein
MTADDGTVDSPVRRRIIDAHTHGAPASGDLGSSIHTSSRR